VVKTISAEWNTLAHSREELEGLEIAHPNAIGLRAEHLNFRRVIPLENACEAIAPARAGEYDLA
jgi:hypothetical protein